jgi:hypothetical protein
MSHILLLENHDPLHKVKDIRQSLAQQAQIIGNTLFGIISPYADFSRFDRRECERIIAEVVQERGAALSPRGEKPHPASSTFTSKYPLVDK